MTHLFLILSVFLFGEYARSDWPHWIDADGDCQDTRAEILIRDNTGTIKFKGPRRCEVAFGEWLCPYTGKTLTKASDVDVDHVIPLSWAHLHGGADWSRQKKRRFANDPDNLLAVYDVSNRKKGSKGPKEWMPRDVYREEYLRKWRSISKKYGLKMGAR